MRQRECPGGRGGFEGVSMLRRGGGEDVPHLGERDETASIVYITLATMN
jgi:hypothetical protein